MCLGHTAVIIACTSISYITLGSSSNEVKLNAIKEQTSFKIIISCCSEWVKAYITSVIVARIPTFETFTIRASHASFEQAEV